MATSFEDMNGLGMSATGLDPINREAFAKVRVRLYHKKAV